MKDQIKIPAYVFLALAALGMYWLGFKAKKANAATTDPNFDNQLPPSGVS